MCVLIALVCIEVKLKSTKTVYQSTHLLMENKKIFIMLVQQIKYFVSYGRFFTMR